MAFWFSSPHHGGARKVIGRATRELVASGLFLYGASLFLVAPSSSTSDGDRATHSNAIRCEGFNQKKVIPRLIFLGTGSSTGCPRPLCTMLFNKQQDEILIQNGKNDPDLTDLKKDFLKACQVSNRAIQGDPKKNKNYRNNPSLLIQHYEDTSSFPSSRPKNVVIDVGKTFRETALRWFPVHGIRSLDAVILTHHHMDAVGGLDDLRGFQRYVASRDAVVNRRPTEMPPKRVSMPVFLSQECLDQVSSQFPWLFPKQKPNPMVAATNKNKPVVKRDVAALDVQVIEDFVPFDASGLKITPLPVLHGDDLVCLGFSFTVYNVSDDDSVRKPTNVVYLSDISKMIPETLEYIRDRLPPTDILIVDTLLMEKPHPVHFNLAQAVELTRQVNPSQGTYLVGMSCDAFPPHDEMNLLLEDRYPDLNIRLAHDGLSIDLI